MTIDSKYFVENSDLLSEPSLYTFNYESIGETTVVVTINTFDIDGNPVSEIIAPGAYEITLGGIEPIYSRGTIDVTDAYVEGSTISFSRSTTITQELDLIAGNPTPTNALEFVYDKMTLIAQELEEELCDCAWGGPVDNPYGPEGPPQPDDPNDPCTPYACSALTDSQIQTTGAVGSGSWDLLDANDTANIPATFQSTGAFGNGVELTCTDAGLGWTAARIQRALLDAGDATLCESPIYCLGNEYSGSGNSSLFLTPQQVWGSSLPNVSVAVVLRDVSVTELRNYIWRGYIDLRYTNQVGNAEVSRAEFNVAIVRVNDGQDWDAVWFNYGQSNGSSWQAKFPVGTFSSTTLLQVSVGVTDLEYTPSSNQTYTFASYDMMCTVGYSVSVSQKGGVGSPLTNAIEYKQQQLFDTTKGNGNDGPINENFKARNNDGTNTNFYLLGGIGAMYNLSVAHSFGGETGRPLVGASGVPGAGTDFSVAFWRNFDDYVLPPECS